MDIGNSCKLAMDCELLEHQCLCSLNSLFEILGSKWIPELLTILETHKVLRFNELEDHLLNISPAVLTKQLKKLQKNGLVIRRQYDEVPRRVEYQLSRMGVKIWEHLNILVNQLEF